MKATQATITVYFGAHSTAPDSGAEDDYRRGAYLFPTFEDAARRSYATYKGYADDLEIPEAERDTLHDFLISSRFLANHGSTILGDHGDYPEMPRFTITEVTIPLDADWNLFHLPV